MIADHLPHAVALRLKTDDLAEGQPVPSSFGNDFSAIPGEHFLQLSSDESQYIEELVKGTSLSPFEDIEAFIFESNVAFCRAPDRLRRRLIRFARSGNADGALLIRGLPVDPELPNSPADSRRSPDKRTYVSEFCLTMLATPLGEPFSYIQEKDGDLFQNLVPTRQNESMLSSESSKVLLDFHTEVAFHPYMPDYVMLAGLRQDHDRMACTPVASIRRLLPLLSPDQRRILQQPLFETGIDYSFGGENAKKGGGPTISVLYGDSEDPFFRFDPDLMLPKTAEAESVFQEVRSLLPKTSNHARLQPGDVVIVDNRRTVHARSQFTARYDGKDRWIQRICALRDFNGSAAERRQGERIIRTQFNVE